MVELNKEELKTMVKSFQRDKIPRPYEFYLWFYDFIKDVVFKVVDEYRGFRQVIGALNATFLALITKKESPSSFKEFIPISLCNTIYKMLKRRLRRFSQCPCQMNPLGFLHRNS
jgi:hypothetical protein